MTSNKPFIHLLWRLSDRRIAMWQIHTMQDHVALGRMLCLSQCILRGNPPQKFSSHTVSIEYWDLHDSTPDWKYQIRIVGPPLPIQKTLLDVSGDKLSLLTLIKGPQLYSSVLSILRMNYVNGCRECTVVDERVWVQFAWFCAIVWQANYMPWVCRIARDDANRVSGPSTWFYR